MDYGTRRFNAAFTKALSYLFFAVDVPNHLGCGYAIKFCSDTYFSGLSLKSQPREPQLKIPPEAYAQRFYVLKNPSISAGFDPTNLGSRGEYCCPKNTKAD